MPYSSENEEMSTHGDKMLDSHSENNCYEIEIETVHTMPDCAENGKATGLNCDDKMLDSKAVTVCDENKDGKSHESSVDKNTNEFLITNIVENDDKVPESNIVDHIPLAEFPIKLKERIHQFSHNLSQKIVECYETNSADPDQDSEADSPIKIKKKFRKISDHLLEDTDELEKSSGVDHVKGSADLDHTSDADSPIKVKKKHNKFFNNRLKNTNEAKNTGTVDFDKKESADLDESSDTDSPIKRKKRFRRFSDDSDKVESVVDSEENESAGLDQVSEADSPIKRKKKFRRHSNDILNSDKVESIDHDKKESANLDQTSDADSPIKGKKKSRRISDDIQDDQDVISNASILEHTDQDQISSMNSDILKKNITQYTNETENIETEFKNSEINDQTMEESFPNILNENDSSLDDDDSTVKRPRSEFIRDVKGKELIRQSLSLPYFHLPKPDFREYMNETDRRLEEPLLKIRPDSSQKQKLSNKITLKHADNIVFEIGPPRVDKVEPFRKKVLNMMSRCNGSKSDTVDKAGGHQKSMPKAIGAERLSWKMKLLNDIAKKKEAALKERNEMLEEALEINEENQSIESETEDFAEDDVIETNDPVSDTLLSTADVDDDSLPELTNGQDDSLPELPAGYQDPLFNKNEPDKPCEVDKEIESSPLCFSLPSFQPQGGFSSSMDHSTSIVTNVSQVDLSFNETESEKENPSLSLFGSSDLLSSNPLPPMSQNDEIVYDKVLAKENLLASKHNISRDMITADVMDICSGQFPDEDELPKTPPLINISADEESEGDISDSNCPTFHPTTIESDSDSEDELRFKRKVLKKRIRPISPIDEESRYGEEDTRVHPASVLLEANSNFNFSKTVSDHCSDSEDDKADDIDIDQQNLHYDSEESLIDGSKEVQKAPRNVRDYFENEAELSGEEGSSDEDEHDLDGEDPLICTEDADLPANEELRDQIGTLHLKHLLDDDDRAIRQVKNHFLEEGELFSDVARQRKFNWSFNQVEAVHNPNSSGSENEEEVSETPFHGDKIKWMQENGNKKNEDETDHSFDTSFKVGVRRKITTQIVADRLAHSFNKRPRNSFLDEEEAKKSLKKIKLDVTNAQGSRVTKNFVFVEANENGSVKKKVANPKNSIDSSVFDLI